MTSLFIFFNNGCRKNIAFLKKWMKQKHWKHTRLCVWVCRVSPRLTHWIRLFSFNCKQNNSLIVLDMQGSKHHETIYAKYLSTAGCSWCVLGQEKSSWVLEVNRNKVWNQMVITFMTTKGTARRKSTCYSGSHHRKLPHVTRHICFHSNNAILLWPVIAWG